MAERLDNLQALSRLVGDEISSQNQTPMHTTPVL